MFQRDIFDHHDLTEADRKRLTDNVFNLMAAIHPLEFCCYEVINHAGDLAVAMEAGQVVHHLNEARLLILAHIEQRITTQFFDE